MIKVNSNKQKGQAIVEYILIAIILVAALWAPFPGDAQNRSAITILVEAIKQEYRAYKYAHSVGNVPLS